MSHTGVDKDYHDLIVAQKDKRIAELESLHAECDQKRLAAKEERNIFGKRIAEQCELCSEDAPYSLIDENGQIAPFVCLACHNEACDNREVENQRLKARVAELEAQRNAAIKRTDEANRNWSAKTKEWQDLRAKLAEVEALNKTYHEERQELRTILRFDATAADGTRTAEFDPQPALVEAAKRFRDRVAELEESLVAAKSEATTAQKYAGRQDNKLACTTRSLNALRAKLAEVEKERDEALANLRASHHVLCSGSGPVGETGMCCSCRKTHKSEWSELKRERDEARALIRTLVDALGDLEGVSMCDSAHGDDCARCRARKALDDAARKAGVE